jgi:hypothetical protein
VTVFFCHTTGSGGVTRQNVRKIITPSYDVGEDELYMKIVALDEIYNFVVLSFFSFEYVKILKN